MIVNEDVRAVVDIGGQEVSKQEGLLEHHFLHFHAKVRLHPLGQEVIEPSAILVVDQTILIDSATLVVKQAQEVLCALHSIKSGMTFEHLTTNTLCISAAVQNTTKVAHGMNQAQRERKRWHGLVMSNVFPKIPMKCQMYRIHACTHANIHTSTHTYKTG